MACVVGTVAGCLATAHILQAQRHRPLPACCDHSAAGRDGQGGPRPRVCAPQGGRVGRHRGPAGRWCPRGVAALVSYGRVAVMPCERLRHQKAYLATPTGGADVQREGRCSRRYLRHTWHDNPDHRRSGARLSGMTASPVPITMASDVCPKGHPMLQLECAAAGCRAPSLQKDLLSVRL